jgi:tetratricopeptide (TPR) repeat protein
MRPAALSKLLERAQKSYRAVDAEARVLGPASTTGSVVVSMLLALVAAGGLAASTPEEERALFERGAQEYAARQFVEAERSFGEITRIAPDAPDAWANFGTVAWAAGDTAAAVVGWQRALRLEPLARDVRSRLGLIESIDLRSHAWVPPMSMMLIAILIAVLWVGAWLLALVRAAGRTAIPRNLIAFAAMSAILLIAGGILLDERLAAKNLSVVGETTMLRALPALAGDAVLNVHPGEIVRTLSRRGEWILVQLDGGREGWIEAPILISIARN